jgi:capsular polysaccharide biosynthesis protein
LRDHFCRIPVFAGPRAYWCADWYSNSYFHWLIETLARVHLATLEAESPVVYLPATVAVFPFVRESFALFPEVDFRILQWRETLWASRLHWVSPMGSGYQFNRRLMQLLRERIRKAGEPSGCTDNPRRLHVSRRKSGKRKLLNEEAIERCLSARGFQTVYFEELSLRRQIELCAGAEALVGIHGAGLANALFLPKNSVVLEMQMFQTWPSCYFRLCNALDLKYYYLYGRHSPPSATSESEADLEVDAGRLETILDAAGL